MKKLNLDVYEPEAFALIKFHYSRISKLNNMLDCKTMSKEQLADTAERRKKSLDRIEQIQKTIRGDIT